MKLLLRQGNNFGNRIEIRRELPQWKPAAMNGPPSEVGEITQS